jgi:hypothetical protein
LVVVGLALIGALVGSCLLLTARMLSLGLRDAEDLAAKLSQPHPRSAAQWPELQIDRMINDVDASDHVLLVVCWPAHPARRALLVVHARSTDHGRLERWCHDDARLFPRALGDGQLLFRRRRSSERVGVRILEERPWSAEAGRRRAN